MWIVSDVCKLTQAERNILLSPCEWLNDNLINTAQAFLKQQSPVAGLQSTDLSITFAFEIQREFIQILHDGHGHWLMVSNIGAKDHTELLVYDNMYPTVGSVVKQQNLIAALLACSETTIKLKMMDVQIQTGGSDCGLFAIAFSIALINGEQPGRFFFNHNAMRSHLAKCLEDGRITMFPVSEIRRRGGLVKSEDVIPVYCSCRMPELLLMVQCNSCKEWFHVQCETIPTKVIKNPSLVWECRQCNHPKFFQSRIQFCMCGL